jgi:hypothetical protein
MEPRRRNRNDLDGIWSGGFNTIDDPGTPNGKILIVQDVRIVGMITGFSTDKEDYPEMTDLESDLRRETRNLSDRDVLAGYRLVAFDGNGGSSWYNKALDRHLYRDPDGSVCDPATLRPVNYAKDMVETKRYIEEK